MKIACSALVLYQFGMKAIETKDKEAHTNLNITGHSVAELVLYVAAQIYADKGFGIALSANVQLNYYPQLFMASHLLSTTTADAIMKGSVMLRPTMSTQADISM